MGKKKKGDKAIGDDERKLSKKLKKAAKQVADARDVPTAVPEATGAPAPTKEPKPARGARPAKEAATPPATAAKPERAVSSAPQPAAATMPPAPEVEKVPTPAHVAPGNFAVNVPVVALKVLGGTLLVATKGKHLPQVSLGSDEKLVGAAARALAHAGLAARHFRLLPLATDLEGPATLDCSWVALGRPGEDEGTWVPVADAPARAVVLVRTAVERLATLLETTTIGAALCATEFTVGELRETYAAVWGADPDGRNFHRKVTGVPDFLVETGERTSRSGGRPAMLYRAGAATQLNPAVTRAS